MRTTLMTCLVAGALCASSAVEAKPRADVAKQRKAAVTYVDPGYNHNDASKTPFTFWTNGFSYAILIVDINYRVVMTRT